jgi:hypothetical protein
MKQNSLLYHSSKASNDQRIGPRSEGYFWSTPKSAAFVFAWIALALILARVLQGIVKSSPS